MYPACYYSNEIALDTRFTFKIFMPNLALGIEYQGEMHYLDIPVYGTLESHQRKDQQKAAAAKLLGITLIPIPFWWGRSADSLAATIKQVRPDIQLSNVKYAEPISQVMPPKYSHQNRGDPYRACIGKLEIGDIDPKGWQIAELFDGVRVFWNGQQLITSDLRPVSIPNYVAQQFPAFSFEGTLW
jgi:hypothetical protein